MMIRRDVGDLSDTITTSDSPESVNQSDNVFNTSLFRCRCCCICDPRRTDLAANRYHNVPHQTIVCSLHYGSLPDDGFAFHVGYSLLEQSAVVPLTYTQIHFRRSPPGPKRGPLPSSLEGPKVCFVSEDANENFARERAPSVPRIRERPSFVRG